MNAHVLTITLIALIGGGPAATGSALAGEREPRPPLLAVTGGARAPRLLATFVHTQAERSMAMVNTAGAATQTMHVNHELGDGLRVHAIARDHIVVARGTQRFTLPLWGQPATGKTPARAIPGQAASNRGGNTVAATSARPAANTTQLRADNLNEVRAACADPTLMQALPDAERAELAATGVCNAH